MTRTKKPSRASTIARRNVGQDVILSYSRVTHGRNKEHVVAPGTLCGGPMRSMGVITKVEPDSLAADLGLKPGDELLAVNGFPVEDMIDVQFYAAEEHVELTVRRNVSDGTTAREFVLGGEREYDQPLGLEFAHPTFDIDIRRCNNLCTFCFVLQMAPRMRRTLYIKDDDYRYSFLYGHFVTLTNLSEHDRRRIEEQHLSPLYVSVHATELDVRRKLLRNDDAPDILEQLRWLAQCGIEVHTQIVVTPGLNDGEHLERSVRDLAEFWPTVRSVSIVPVGITRHHKYAERPNTPAEMKVVLDRVRSWQREFRRKLGVRFAYLTDEWYLVTGRPIPPRAHYDGLRLEENGLGMVRGFLEDWRKAKRKISNLKSQISRATLATGELFAPVLREAAKEIASLSGVRVDVVPIHNERLGRTITVAGLLMGTDVIAQLQTHDRSDLVVLPRIMFDHPTGVALDDVSVSDIEEALGRPVTLAATMSELLSVLTGRVQPLHSNSML
jgi:putative radical SAM enzyme (TIGR03279 family)